MSSNPNSLTAATESPPPTRENAPAAVALEMASPMAMVPLAKVSISKTPTGPFHKMVLDWAMTSANCAKVFGPASKPSHPSGIAKTSATCGRIGC